MHLNRTPTTGNLLAGDALKSLTASPPCGLPDVRFQSIPRTGRTRPISRAELFSRTG